MSDEPNHSHDGDLKAAGSKRDERQELANLSSLAYDPKKIDKLINAPKLKSLGAALFGGKKNNYKNPKEFTTLENNASQAEYFESKF